MPLTKALGGDIARLGAVDVLSRGAKLGNVKGPGGGFKDSPLAGSLLGENQLNNVNIARNDTTDPLNATPSAADAMVIAIPNDTPVISVAAISTSPDIGGGGDGSGASSPGDPGDAPGAPGDPGGGPDGGDGSGSGSD